MRTDLKKHNEIAYRKVMKALETSDRTCVVHPTGTGKSYLIAAVSESYNKVLILGPNNFVLDQVHDVLKWRKRGVEYMTYTTLNLTENPHTDYDLICLDEFHRAGAQEWGVAVDRLLELNKQAKVFGTTATHIRYLDDNRNMADELFHGNIASHITIAEAWNQNILPIPRYVSGLFRWDKTVGEAQERIERSCSLSDKEKRERIYRLNNSKLHWELSYGMPSILKKHLDKDARRVIVFCGNIESLEQMRQEVVGWFREAGFVIADTCLMHSSLTDSEQRKQMRRFEDNDSTALKLMFSVNMLNEGIHVPNVNAVLMLRTTSSRIIYMQQMGRCLTAANTQKPLVLDMVDNITTTTAIKDLQDEFDTIEIPQAEHEGREPRKFEVKDYTLGVKQLIEMLVPQDYNAIPFAERIERAKAFCDSHKRVPGRKDDRKEYLNWVALLKDYKDRDEVQSLIEQYSRFADYEKRIKMLTAFCEKNGRVPGMKDDKKERRNWINIMRLYSDNPEVKQLTARYGNMPLSFEELLEPVVLFCRKNDRLPRRNDHRDIWNKWTVLCRKHKDRKELNELKEQYGTRGNVDRRIRIVADFCAKEGRLPREYDDRVIWNGWVILKKRHKDHPEVIEIYEKYGKPKNK